MNPWARPLQKPHPPIWIPGVVSRETTLWAAKHRYPFICLNTTIEATKKIWAVYNEAAEEEGYTPGTEHRGYLLRVHVQDTEEKALENAREYLWMMGEFTGLVHPTWSSPAGYSSPRQRRAWVEIANGRRASPRGEGAPSLEKQIETMQIVAGTPDQVVTKLRVLMEETRPGIFAFWGNDGGMGHQDSMRCIELLGKEVMPAVRDNRRRTGPQGPVRAQPGGGGGRAGRRVDQRSTGSSGRAAQSAKDPS